MVVIDVPDDLSVLDRCLQEVPNSPAVFLLWPKAGEPYLAKTALLRRRLLRLLSEREKPSRLLNLRHTVCRIEYLLTGSALESNIRLYELARAHFPDRYLEVLKLRMPPYMKVVLTNRFPRTQITTHLGRSPGFYFGPFRARASAERFQSEFLNLFQIRRCQDDLIPSVQHPGCIYGEMGMCLRPCQEVVGPDEYRHEVDRGIAFLASDGRSLLNPVASARDRLSEEMNFEEAARQHKRLEKIQEVLNLRDELARDIDRLHGVAITTSAVPGAVELWCLRRGFFQAPQRVTFEVAQTGAISLDRKLRDIIGALEPRTFASRQRQEYLALLARWYYSSWRDGEWLRFEDFEDVPYRKLVHAISRVARQESS